MNVVTGILVVLALAFNGIGISKPIGAAQPRAVSTNQPSTIPAAQAATPATRPAIVAKVIIPTTAPVSQIARPPVAPAPVVPATAPPLTTVVTASLPTTRLSTTLPSTPGHARLRFFTTIDNRPADLCVVVSTSKKIAAMPGRIPLLIFLGGMGDRGSDGNGVFRNGPPAEMMRHVEINESLPMLVVSPQCPAGRQWAEPGVANAVVELVAILAKDPRIDPNRIYLGGFSLGGTGTWAVADAGAQYFAAISPIAPREFDVESSTEALSNLPTWIICGDKDPVFFKGSLAMLGFMRKAGADVTLSIMPGAGHDEWQKVYLKLNYYDWFLAHTKGKPASRDFSAAELASLVNARVIDPITARVTKDFSTFSPYWQISNFSVMGNPGLKPETLGHKNIFEVRPLNSDVSCQMQTTWNIPASKHGRLVISAGWDGTSDWKLVVNVADRDVLSTPIDKTTAAGGWYQATIDLSQYSGKKVHVDVMVAPGKQGPGPVYLEKLGVELQ